jgi:hypothetical protein
MLDNISYMHQIKCFIPVASFISKCWQGTIQGIPEVKLLVVVMGKALLIYFYHQAGDVKADVHWQRVSLKTVENPIRITAWNIDHRFHIKSSDGFFDNPK